MKNALLFLAILLSNAACQTEYVYVNSCAADICDEPETVEDYIVAYHCKDGIVKSCNKNPSEN